MSPPPPAWWQRPGSTASRLGLVLAALPLAIAASNLLMVRRPSRWRGRPSISVLIPARDEEATIAAAVTAILASRDIDLELIVLDDHSTDGTRAVLNGIHDDRLRVIPAPDLPSGWHGKPHACSCLGQAASHELMLFLDADVRVFPDSLNRLATWMNDNPAVDLASGVPRQIVCGVLERLLIPLIHLVLFGYLPMILDEGDRPAFAAACGQLILVRRSAWRMVGGHAAVRARLHDALSLARAFRRAGLRTAVIDVTDLAVCRMYRSNRAVWAGLSRNATEGMATPKALPVWTFLLAGGHVFPLIQLGRRVDRASVSALACAFGLRALLAIRFRQDMLSVAASPLGVALLLLLQWRALFHKLMGRPVEWRGRLYSSGKRQTS